MALPSINAVITSTGIASHPKTTDTCELYNQLATETVCIECDEHSVGCRSCENSKGSSQNCVVKCDEDAGFKSITLPCTETESSIKLGTQVVVAIQQTDHCEEVTNDQKDKLRIGCQNIMPSATETFDKDASICPRIEAIVQSHVHISSSVLSRGDTDECNVLEDCILQDKLVVDGTVKDTVENESLVRNDRCHNDFRNSSSQSEVINNAYLSNTSDKLCVRQDGDTSVPIVETLVSSRTQIDDASVAIAHVQCVVAENELACTAKSNLSCIEQPVACYYSAETDCGIEKVSSTNVTCLMAASMSQFSVDQMTAPSGEYFSCYDNRNMNHSANKMCDATADEVISEQISLNCETKSEKIVSNPVLSIHLHHRSEADLKPCRSVVQCIVNEPNSTIKAANLEYEESEKGLNTELTSAALCVKISDPVTCTVCVSNLESGDNLSAGVLSVVPDNCVESRALNEIDADVKKVSEISLKNEDTNKCVESSLSKDPVLLCDVVVESPSNSSSYPDTPKKRAVYSCPGDPVPTSASLLDLKTHHEANDIAESLSCERTAVAGKKMSKDLCKDSKPHNPAFEVECSDLTEAGSAEPALVCDTEVMVTCIENSTCKSSNGTVNKTNDSSAKIKSSLVSSVNSEKHLKIVEPCSSSGAITENITRRTKDKTKVSKKMKSNQEVLSASAPSEFDKAGSQELSSHSKREHVTEPQQTECRRCHISGNLSNCICISENSVSQSVTSSVDSSVAIQRPAQNNYVQLSDIADCERPVMCPSLTEGANPLAKIMQLVADMGSGLNIPAAQHKPIISAQENVGMRTLVPLMDRVLPGGKLLASIVANASVNSEALDLMAYQKNTEYVAKIGELSYKCGSSAEPPPHLNDADKPAKMKKGKSKANQNVSISGVECSMPPKKRSRAKKLTDVSEFIINTTNHEALHISSKPAEGELVAGKFLNKDNELMRKGKSTVQRKKKAIIPVNGEMTETNLQNNSCIVPNVASEKPTVKKGIKTKVSKINITKKDVVESVVHSCNAVSINEPGDASSIVLISTQCSNVGSQKKKQTASRSKKTLQTCDAMITMEESAQEPVNTGNEEKQSKVSVEIDLPAKKMKSKKKKGLSHSIDVNSVTVEKAGTVGSDAEVNKVCIAPSVTTDEIIDGNANDFESSVNVPKKRSRKKKSAGLDHNKLDMSIVSRCIDVDQFKTPASISAAAEDGVGLSLESDSKNSGIVTLPGGQMTLLDGGTALEVTVASKNSKSQKKKSTKQKTSCEQNGSLGNSIACSLDAGSSSLSNTITSCKGFNSGVEIGSADTASQLLVDALCSAEPVELKTKRKRTSKKQVSISIDDIAKDLSVSTKIIPMQKNTLTEEKRDDTIVAIADFKKPRKKRKLVHDAVLDVSSDKDQSGVSVVSCELKAVNKEANNNFSSSGIIDKICDMTHVTVMKAASELPVEVTESVTAKKSSKKVSKANKKTKAFDTIGLKLDATDTCSAFNLPSDVQDRENINCSLTVEKHTSLASNAKDDAVHGCSFNNAVVGVCDRDEVCQPSVKVSIDGQSSVEENFKLHGNEMREPTVDGIEKKKKKKKKIVVEESVIGIEDSNVDSSRPSDEGSVVSNINPSKQFSCPSCSYSSNKKGQLRKHLSVHRVFACAHCMFVGSDHPALEEHMTVAHPSRCGRRLCKRCHMLFRMDNGAFAEHEKSCTGEKFIWSCSYCNKQFKFVSAMKTHVRRWHVKKTPSFTDTSDEQLTSEVADEPVEAAVIDVVSTTFSDAEQTKEHLKLEEKAELDQSSSISVDFTALTVSAIGGETTAVKDDTAILERRFKCTQCEKTFKARRSMVHHRKMVHEGGRLLKQRIKLGNSVHTVGDVIDMPVSDLVFDQQETQCENMNFTSPPMQDSSQLSDAMNKPSSNRSHGDIELFVDPDSQPIACDNKAVVNSATNELDSAACADVVVAPKGRRPTVFACKAHECNHTFKRPGQLHRHEERHASPDEKTFRCDWPDCRKRFLYSQNMLAHRRQHVDPKPYRCIQCPLAYWQKSSLRSHQSKAHGSSVDIANETTQLEGSDDNMNKLVLDPQQGSSLTQNSDTVVSVHEDGNKIMNEVETGSELNNSKDKDHIADVSKVEVSTSKAVDEPEVKTAEQMENKTNALSHVSVEVESKGSSEESGSGVKSVKKSTQIRRKKNAIKGKKTIVTSTDSVGNVETESCAAIPRFCDDRSSSVNAVDSAICIVAHDATGSAEIDGSQEVMNDAAKSLNVYEFCEEESVDIKVLKSCRVGTSFSRVPTRPFSCDRDSNIKSLESVDQVDSVLDAAVRDVPKRKKKKQQKRGAGIVVVNAEEESANIGGSDGKKENDSAEVGSKNLPEVRSLAEREETHSHIDDVAEISCDTQIDSFTNSSASATRLKRSSKRADTTVTIKTEDNEVKSKGVAGRKRSGKLEQYIQKAVVTAVTTSETCVKKKRTAVVEDVIKLPAEDCTVLLKDEVSRKGKKSSKVVQEKTVEVNSPKTKIVTKVTKCLKDKKTTKVEPAAVVETRSKTRFLIAEAEKQTASEKPSKISPGARKIKKVLEKPRSEVVMKNKKLVVVLTAETSIFLPSVKTPALVKRLARRRKGKKRRGRAPVISSALDCAEDNKRSTHWKKSKLLEMDELEPTNVTTDEAGLIKQVETECFKLCGNEAAETDEAKQDDCSQNSENSLDISSGKAPSPHQRDNTIQDESVDADTVNPTENDQDAESEGTCSDIHGDIDIMPPAPAAMEVTSDVESQASPGSLAPVQSPRSYVRLDEVSNHDGQSATSSQSPQKDKCDQGVDNMQTPQSQCEFTVLPDENDICSSGKDLRDRLPEPEAAVQDELVSVAPSDHNTVISIGAENTAVAASSSAAMESCSPLIHSFRVPVEEVRSFTPISSENSISFIDMVHRAAMNDSASGVYPSVVEHAVIGQNSEHHELLDRSAVSYQDALAPPYPSSYPLLPMRSDRRPLHSLDGLTSDAGNYMAGSSLPGTYFDSSSFVSRSLPDPSMPSYGMQLPAYGVEQQSQLTKAPSYLPYGVGSANRVPDNQSIAESAMYGRGVPAPAFPSDAFAKDLFGQYFPESSLSTLPVHSVLQDQRGSGNMIGGYQQTPMIPSGMHSGESGSDLFRRAYSGVGESFMGVKSTTMLGTQVPSSSQSTQYWMSSSVENIQRDRASPHHASQSNADVTRNSYASLNEPKRLDASHSMFPGTAAAVSRSPSFDRYTIPGGGYSLAYSPPTAGSSSYTSHAVPPPQSSGTSPRRLEDAYRQMADYRTLAAAHRHRSSGLPQAADMYGGASAAALSSLDHYYYSARDAMYRSQQLAAAAAMPHAFMPQSSVAPQYVDRAAAYGRETTSSYGQSPAYGFGYSSDSQYLPSSSRTGKSTTASASDYFAGADAAAHSQDPYRHSVIYNMMPRYF